MAKEGRKSSVFTAKPIENWSFLYPMLVCYKYKVGLSIRMLVDVLSKKC
jgi:hypothetical protein